MIKRHLRRLLERALASRGYALKPAGEPLRGFAASLAYAKTRGLAPRTVFDVGVGHGTPWLYAAFPRAKLVLFEPLDIFAADLAHLERTLGADVHTTALGARCGVAALNLNATSPTGSTLHTIDPGYAAFSARRQREFRFERREVPLATLDSLNRYEPPYVLKIDVEGAELDVLEGARQTLTETALVIAEVSILRRTIEGGQFADVVRWMDERGFALFDIPSMAQAHDERQLIYVDCAFAPKAGALWPR